MAGSDSTTDEDRSGSVFIKRCREEIKYMAVLGLKNMVHVLHPYGTIYEKMLRLGLM